MAENSGGAIAGRNLRTVIVPQAPVRKLPRHDASLETEALKGEQFVVIEENDEGWCRGELVSDGYPGWMPSGMLDAGIHQPTHRVSALRTFLFPGPSIKLPPVESPPLGSRLAIRNIAGELAETADGHYVPARHLADLVSKESDFVAVAGRFVGSPYLWGGKTNAGIDCSGLVQIAATVCGIVCPRDSIDQEKRFGVAVASDADLSKLSRGDLLFWPGHVAIACGKGHMVHANAYHMAVAIEPIVEAVARIAAAGSVLRSVGRMR